MANYIHESNIFGNPGEGFIFEAAAAEGHLGRKSLPDLETGLPAAAAFVEMKKASQHPSRDEKGLNIVRLQIEDDAAAASNLKPRRQNSDLRETLKQVENIERRF